ncbi:MAG: S9 family peptidase [Acidobacteria bacterium]|nr:S9 family peptidase [Acidobacteriota bacterium]
MGSNTLLLATVALALAAAGSPGEGRKRSREIVTGDRLTLARVARYPPPGTRIPGGFRFGHDGRYLYFLGLEGGGSARALFREEVATGDREIVARPPQAASPSESGLTPEEILRRERQRIQEKGITLYALAARADVAVFDWRGDVYLVRPGQDPLRLTETPASEIDPQLSPGGTRLAFARDGDLYVLDLASLEETRLTEGARDGVSHGIAEYIAQEEMDRSSGFWWSPDGSRIAYAEVDETGVPVYPIVHQGKAEREVESTRYPFAGGPNARVRLGIVPVQGGDTVWVRLPDTGDDFYIPRVRWDEGGSLLVQVQSRDQRRLRLVRADPVTGGATLLLEDRSDTWVDLHDDLRPLRDGRFLWSSAATGFRHLELRGRDGALIRRLTSGDWPIDALEGVDEEEGLVFFSGAREGPLERPIYRTRLDGGPVERVTADPGWHQAVFSRDGRLFVDVHDSAAAPPRVLLRDAAGREVRLLDANADPEPEALGLEPPEFVTLKTAGNVLLHGAIYKPRPLQKGRKHPAIVRVYGGPTALSVKNSWELTQDLRAQYLARHGYVVFRLDNRGTPRRGRAFEAALDRRLGSVEAEDQIAGARYLAGLPYVDEERIGIYGWSYGGYMAARCILKAPDLFKAAVAGAPVADWDGYDTHYTERYMGTPRENAAGYRDSSLLPLAPLLEGRLLIVHGMADENVHFRHTARFLNALNSARRRYDLLVFPDERHLPRGEEDRRYLETRIVEHFDRALK